MSEHRAELKDRGVVRATGTDAGKLLDGLITNDMDLLVDVPALHAGLLSPQGKILFAFFVVKSGDEFFLDVGRAHAAALVKRLNFYKLRAQAQFTDVSAEMTVAVSWGGTTPSSVPRGILSYPDPRDPNLSQRMILPIARLPELGTMDATLDAYHTHRISLGVPDDDADYAAGDTFPHEANFDLLNGVSFTKGCYVGQEVVSRTQNKAVVRKRIVRITGDDLVTGAEIKHGSGVVGTVGSVAGQSALATLRLDRAAEAVDKSEQLLVNGHAIAVDAGAIASYRASAASRPVIDL